MEYIGSKFRPTGEFVRYIDNNTNEVCYKEKLIPTKGYIEFLKEKEQYKLWDEIIALKHKMEYAQKTYGEIDNIDKLLYESKIRQYYQHYGV